MKILEDLYYTPELYEPLRSPACRKELRDLDQTLKPLYDQLYKSLSDSQRELFNKVEHLFNERTCAEERHAFLAGFRLAAHIFNESLADEP